MKIRIDRKSEGDTVRYTVGHYVKYDPVPIPTVRDYPHYLDAYNDALARAAKLSILTGKAIPIEDKTTGRAWSVKTRETGKKKT